MYLFPLWAGQFILFSSLAAVAAFGTPANASIFGTNLIVNGDAESGTGSLTGYTVETIPGWNALGNFTGVEFWNIGSGFPLNPDLFVNRGLNFFAGGPENASSSAWQVIDLTSVPALLIWVLPPSI